MVPFGCETLSLTVREEHKPRVFDNRVLRRIFGPNRDGLLIRGDIIKQGAFVAFQSINNSHLCAAVNKTAAEGRCFLRVFVT
jgi:hypothetical protein